MEELPLDVITNILFKLPAKSLSRFKCANKLWKELIESPYLVRRQCDHAHTIHDERQTYIVHHQTCGSEHNFKNMVYDEINPDPIIGPLFTFPIDIIPPVFVDNWVDVMGHCDGMLCVRVVQHLQEKNLDSTCGVVVNKPTIRSSSSIVLWNPTIRDFEKLPSLPKEHYNYESYGLGHNPQIGDYYVCKIPCSSGNQVLGHNLVEIYYFKTRSWRTICKLENYHVRMNEQAVFVNGNLHWLSCSVTARKLVIIYFNPIEEKFEDLALPFPLGFEDPFEDPILDVVHGYLYVIKRCVNGVFYWVYKESRWIMVHHIPKAQSLGIERMRNGWCRREVLCRPLCVTRNCIYLSAGKYSVKRFELKGNKSGSFEMKSEEVFCLGMGNLHSKKKYMLAETLVSPSRLLSHG